MLGTSQSMSANESNSVPKMHPATREMLPDDPLEMQACQFPGDPELMLRLLVEEYARLGWNLDALMELTRDPNYLAFHAFRQSQGEERLRRRIGEILARCGVMRVKTRESTPLSEQLVQLEMPA